MYKQADKLFGEMMRRTRNQKKMTQEQLAENVDISVTYCRLIEQGKYNCSWVIWLKICKALDLDMDEIYNLCIKGTQKQ